MPPKTPRNASFDAYCPNFLLIPAVAVIAHMMFVLLSSIDIGFDFARGWDAGLSVLSSIWQWMLPLRLRAAAIPPLIILYLITMLGTASFVIANPSWTPPFLRRFAADDDPPLSRRERRFKSRVEEAEAAKERYRKERIDAEAVAARERKMCASAVHALADKVEAMGTTVNQHTGQIGDLQGGQKEHATQIRALEEDNSQLNNQLDRQGEATMVALEETSENRGRIHQLDDRVADLKGDVAGLQGVVGDTQNRERMNKLEIETIKDRLSSAGL